MKWSANFKGGPVRRLRAIILHRTPAREKDRIVEVFSREEGRLKLLAAGVRRFPSRRAGHLEPLMESVIVFSASHRGDSIRDARVLHSFPRMREELRRLRVAYYLANLLREGTGEHLADPRLYDAVSELLLALDRPDARVTPLFLFSADIQLLRHLGMLPETSTCGRCRRPLRANTFSFDEKETMFLCRHCRPDAPVAPYLTDAVKLLRLLATHPVPPARLRVSAGAASELPRLTSGLLESMRVHRGI